MMIFGLAPTSSSADDITWPTSSRAAIVSMSSPTTVSTLPPAESVHQAEDAAVRLGGSIVCESDRVAGARRSRIRRSEVESINGPGGMRGAVYPGQGDHATARGRRVVADARLARPPSRIDRAICSEDDVSCAFNLQATLPKQSTPALRRRRRGRVLELRPARHRSRCRGTSRLSRRGVRG